jgi:alpha-glucosidase
MKLMPVRKLSVVGLLAGAFALAGCATKPGAAPRPLVLRSPDEAIVVTVSAAGELRYAVAVDRKPVITASRLGLELRAEPKWGRDVAVLRVERRSLDATWENIPGGKRRLIRNHANELVVWLREGSGADFAIIFRAYDDGVALRYVLPGQGPGAEFVLEQESTEFTFAADYPCYFGQHRKPSFRGPQEWEFHPGKLSDLRATDIVGGPLLVQTPAAWVAVTEADLVDWSGMWLAGSAQPPAPGVTVTTKLAPRLDGNGLVRAQFPHQSPWRVILIGRQPGDLIQSDLVLNLARPAMPGDWSWVKPGLMAWDIWWSGGHPPTANPGMTTAMLKHYIQFAADMGWPYQLIDWWWYGEPNTPTSDPRKVNPDVNMDEVLRFAAERRVKLWLWVRWNDLERFESADDFFSRLASWGMAGVKIDFMDRDDQDMVNWYERITATAAKHKLMLNFHGAMKPTGMNRTWPNQVTREAILGNEYNKWSDRITPEHKVTLPFTRLLLGPADYTPGGFRNRQPTQFRRGKPAQVQGTRAAELALFVLYDSPVQCVCDAPEHIRGQIGAEFLKKVPTVWEESRVLAAQVGDYLVMARRAADGSWFLGGLTDGTARELELNFSYLDRGKWKLEWWRDDRQTDFVAETVRPEVLDVTAHTKLKVRLSPAGGFAGRLTQGRK